MEGNIKPPISFGKHNPSASAPLNAGPGGGVVGDPAPAARNEPPVQHSGLAHQPQPQPVKLPARRNKPKIMLDEMIAALDKVDKSIEQKTAPELQKIRAFCLALIHQFIDEVVKVKDMHTEEIIHDAVKLFELLPGLASITLFAQNLCEGKKMIPEKAKNKGKK